MRVVVLTSMGLDLAGLLAAAQGHPTVPFHLSTNPELFPAFHEDVRDYVVRCGEDPPVDVTVVTSRNVRLSVDGARYRPVAFATSGGISSGQIFTACTSDPRRAKRTYRVRCMPSDVRQFTAPRTGRTAQSYIASAFAGAAPAGFSQNYVAIFDTNGVSVWWYSGQTPTLDAKLLANGNVGWLQGAPTIVGAASAEEHRLDASLAHAHTVTTAGNGSDHHENLPLRTGNHLLAMYLLRSGVDLAVRGRSNDATIYDNEVQEIDPQGHVVWSWMTSEHISPAEVPARWRRTVSVQGRATSTISTRPSRTAADS